MQQIWYSWVKSLILTYWNHESSKIYTSTYLPASRWRRPEFFTSSLFTELEQILSSASNYISFFKSSRWPAGSPKNRLLLSPNVHKTAILWRRIKRIVVHKIENSVIHCVTNVMVKLCIQACATTNTVIVHDMKSVIRETNLRATWAEGPGWRQCFELNKMNDQMYYSIFLCFFFFTSFTPFSF